MIRILLVEDNVEVRKAVRSIIASAFPSVRTEEAGEGEELFRKLGTYHPDLVFMDLELPGENGLVLTKKTKAISPETVIAVLTNYDLQEYRQAAYENGASYFLSKESSSPNDILEVVRAVMSVERKY